MSDAQFTNLVSMFFQQADRLGDKPYVWQKTNKVYQSISWKEAAKIVTSLAKALIENGIEPGDRVVLVSENRSEWALADFAIMASGGITVPAYITNTVQDHNHILNNSEAKAVIVSSQKLAAPLLQATHASDSVEFVIGIEELTLQQHLSHPIHSWADMIKQGENSPIDLAPIHKDISPQDTACIIYTSGTGGTPKGVMLPHRSILHNCKGAKRILEGLKLGEETFLSFLPLSHSYEHTAGLMLPTYIGAQIYYAESAEALVNNMQECHPTIMTAVPRLYEMMRQKILRAIEKEGGKKERFFKAAVELGTKRHLGERLGIFGFFFNIALDFLVRKKVKQRFGGRLKAMVSGGGPLNPDVGHFFQGLGICILQGYGQTESGPVISVNTPADIRMQTVGPVLQDTEIRIAEDGEILVRGDLLMNGYWKKPKATAQTIVDGWLHTGDVGFLDTKNYLQITDRKKDIIVNSGGDNLSPQRVEGFLSLQPEISQSMVYGDQKPHLVALIVPEEEYAKQWAKDHDVDHNDIHSLVENEDFQKFIGAAVNRVNSQLSKLEKVRKFVVIGDPFSLLNQQMTPTLKIRRHIIMEQYEDRLLALYNS